MARLRLVGSTSVIALFLATLFLSGCGNTATPTGSGSTTTTSVAPTTTSVGGPATTAESTIPTIPTTGSPTTTLSPQIAHPSSGVEFHSPSGNIHCEIDYGPPETTKVAFCFTDQPPQSVTLSEAGTYTTCTGINCLANPGQGEIELPYGQDISLGPFRCASSTAGMTCTAKGKGFEISRSGIVSA